ncbi:MAG: rod-binding protein [Clostridiales bacterium]|nr:rod-binding protein [Clostridiales bacterium]
MSLNNISGINIQNISDINKAKQANIETDNFKQTLNNAINSGQDDELKEACTEFESYFLNMMFKSMRKTVVSNGGIFGKSNSEKIFQDMLDEQMTDKMAKQGGIGLADMMYKQLSRQNNAIDIKG